MDTTAFTNANLIIQIHIVAALAALVLGIAILWRRKGTKPHKTYGKIWVGLMALVALSSFFINELRTFGPFSAIHILSIITLVSLIQAINAVRKGNIKQHQNILKSLFFGGLVIAGIFTLMPGRILHHTLFGNPEFYLISQTNAWILPILFVGIIGAFIYWKMKREFD